MRPVETALHDGILIVEDEGLIALDLEERLEKLGYAVAGIAATGDEAISMAASQLPSLILMDIRLKGPMDGIEAAERIQKELDIPVVFVSAHTDEKTLERAKFAHGLSYIVKPFDQADLRVHIEFARHRHSRERKLRSREAWLNTTLESVAEAVIATGNDGKVVFLNRAAERLTGWMQAEALGRDLPEVFCVADDRPLEALQGPLEMILAGRATEPWSFECRLFSKDDRAVHSIQGSAAMNRNRESVLGAVLVFRDVSSQKKSEERAQQAKKMEAIAVLAGGLAHDFNNLLTVILGHTEILQRKQQASPQLGEIRKAGELASSLTRQLLTLSRRDMIRPKVLDLNELIEDTKPLLRQSLGGSRLELSLATERCLIDADSAQIRQMLMNLATNARDAMPAGGTLQITTVRKSTSVELTVDDTGTGMTPAVRERIFEPFFTTKGEGQTAGLGLAIVHGIVTQHKGSIEVESQAGRGTTFRLEFPLAVEPTQAGEEAGPIPESPSRHTVLIVEDQEPVRRLLQEQFEDEGFYTLAASSGEEALLITKVHGNTIDVLVTDVMMPKMTGPELARRCLEDNPELRVVFVSGFTQESIPAEFLTGHSSVFVPKPFSPFDLIRKVKSCLAERSTQRKSGADQM
jgi:PAS domain S-box-containing protein